MKRAEDFRSRRCWNCTQQIVDPTSNLQLALISIIKESNFTSVVPVELPSLSRIKIRMVLGPFGAGLAGKEA